MYDVGVRVLVKDVGAAASRGFLTPAGLPALAGRQWALGGKLTEEFFEDGLEFVGRFVFEELLKIVPDSGGQRAKSQQ
jgi:hypothetical protein